MSEVDISEDLPNGDDSAFSEDQPTADDNSPTSQNTSGSSLPQSSISAEQVFVATSHGLLTPDQLQEATEEIKTTHIVIHDQTLTVDSGPKTPTTPLPPPTPATPLCRERGFRYQWDDSVHAEILPVRCKNTNGELHKSKFGSGGRGKCVKSGDHWYTPNEFEALSGRASSKDWKRSIRYGGRTLQCLIEDGILQPHATSCTCAACCDDESVVRDSSTGPVRLFVPYKRRKKDSESGPPSPIAAKKPRTASTKSPTGTTTPMAKEGVVVSLANGGALSRPITVTHAESGETVHIVTTDSAGNIVTGDAMVMTPISLTPGPKPGSTLVTMDVSEQKQWWQLEEMTNNLLQQAQNLKHMLEQVKQQCLMSKEAAVQQIKMQMEKEKQDALNTARIEAQMNLSRMLVEERAQKDIAVQQALAQARAEMQEKMESVTVVSDDKVTYNVTWNHQTTQNNIESIMGAEVEEDLDKEKE